MKRAYAPLLEDASKYFERVKLGDILLVASQHILETNRILFEYLLRHELRPENTYLVGKCYSTNRVAMRRFQHMGIQVSPASIAYDSQRPFDTQFIEYTRRFLEQVRQQTGDRAYRRIVVLEDGGELMTRAFTMFHGRSRVVGIEQTSAGFHRLSRRELNLPVINVARSNAKLELESPEIARAFKLRLNQGLAQLHLQPRSALILGSGALGSALIRCLESSFRTKSFDRIPLLSDFAARLLPTIIRDQDLIVGATGETSIPQRLHGLLRPGTVLASASSSDREFDAVHFRRANAPSGDCHETVSCQGVHLLNGGFPVNFDGGEHSVSLDRIQITLALLFSAVCLATTTKAKRGFVDLDAAVQSRLASRFIALRDKRFPREC